MFRRLCSSLLAGKTFVAFWTRTFNIAMNAFCVSVYIFTICKYCETNHLLCLENKISKLFLIQCIHVHSESTKITAKLKSASTFYYDDDDDDDLKAYMVLPRQEATLCVDQGPAIELETPISEVRRSR